MKKCRIRIDLRPQNPEAIFDWTGDTPDEVLHFRTTTMERCLKDNPEWAESIKITTLVEEQQAWFILHNRGVETYHLTTLTKERLEVPIIGVQMPDGTVLTVDGHHRYYKKWQLKYETIDMYLFPLDMWMHFLLSDEDRKTNVSNIRR